MRHLFWTLLHIGAYFTFPIYGPSLSLLAYLISEILKKFYGDRKFEVIHFYFLGLIIAVLANINIIYTFESDTFLSDYSYAEPSFFPLASLILALGTQFLAVGYNFTTILRIPKLYLKYNLTHNFLNIIFFISLLLAVKDFWLSFSLPGSFQTIIEFTPIVGIFILSRFAGKYDKTDLFIKGIIVMVAASTNALLFAYLRIEILLPILVFIIGYFLGSGSIRSILSTKFVPILIIIILFYSFFEIFGSKRSNVGVGLDRITELQNTSGPEGSILNDQEKELSAFNRSSNVAQISAACGLVADHGHYEGLTTIPLLVAFVPRFLWPEKPVIALGVWYAVEIGAAVEVDDWYNNSVNMTIPGQLFLDFGWYGISIGSFLVGFILKLLWDAVGFYHKKFNLLGVFFGVYLILTAFLGLGADLQIMITFLAIYLSLLVLSKVIKPQNEDTVRRPTLAGK
jgi:hypothetical protein